MDANKLFEENKNLVYHCIKKLGIPRNHRYYDELVQEGFLGLWKACISYDDTKDIVLSTFAMTCIKNQVLGFLKKNNYRFKEMSLEAYILDNGDNITFLDLFPSDDVMEENLYKKQIIENFYNLEFEDKEFLIDYLSGMSRKKLAEKYNISETYVSRKLTKVINVVRKLLKIK